VFCCVFRALSLTRGNVPWSGQPGSRAAVPLIAHWRVKKLGSILCCVVCSLIAAAGGWLSGGVRLQCNVFPAGHGSDRVHVHYFRLAPSSSCSGSDPDSTSDLSDRRCAATRAAGY